MGLSGADLGRFQQAILGAQKLAVRLSHTAIDPEHVLLSLLDQEKGLVPAVFEKAGVSVDAVTVKLQRELDKLPRVTGQNVEPRLTQRLIKLIDAAESEAKKLNDEYVSVEHLLLAATDDTGLTGKTLKEFGLTRERLMSALTNAYGKSVHLNVVHDPEIVGGMSVQIGDELIDGTAATRLGEVRRKLAG